MLARYMTQYDITLKRSVIRVGALVWTDGGRGRKGGRDSAMVDSEKDLPT